MGVYKNNNLTADAAFLNKETNRVMKSIIEDALDAGMEIEEIMYIIYGVAHRIALGYKIRKRLNNE